MSRELALQTLADLTAARDAANLSAETRDAEWRDGIKTALAAGATCSEVAGEAGITRGRVWQINNNRR